METGSDIEMQAWAKGLSTGREHIDKQHHQIISLVKELEQYGREKPVAGKTPSFILSNLLLSMTHHFRNEEAMLQKNGCPWFQEHVSSHVFFIEKLSGMHMLGASETLDQAVPFIMRWLAVHAAEEDMKCRPYLSLMPETMEQPANQPDCEQWGLSWGKKRGGPEGPPLFMRS